VIHLSDTKFCLAAKATTTTKERKRMTKSEVLNWRLKAKQDNRMIAFNLYTIITIIIYNNKYNNRNI
jgi:hypothetical protein